MLRTHCVLHYKSGAPPARYTADTMPQIEAIMEQASRQARKRGDEVLYWSCGVYNDAYEKALTTHGAQQPCKSALQLPNAPFDE